MRSTPDAYSVRVIHVFESVNISEDISYLPGISHGRLKVNPELAAVEHAREEIALFVFVVRHHGMLFAHPTSQVLQSAISLKTPGGDDECYGDSSAVEESCTCPEPLWENVRGRS